ncbi:type II toxin-antitoxin system RelE/ParE family toxin [Nesterenkonia ebinurensis]|uniref:type II toxin-antitoxin system RelE/ParE family toxin n=1 Tax=Nesterenkonia ebinurensis TaxID=2608252 RepID=UPI00123CB97D|nr:type II toxin-antitoxin system RelE/ParE family toxin [Nesterenkonia ebinurensis]
MIISFRHKGLQKYFETGSKRGIEPEHAPRLRLILATLHQTTGPEDLSLPSFRLHQLTGDVKEHWSMRVSGNWRVTFRFVGQDVELVDYQDYH